MRRLPFLVAALLILVPWLPVRTATSTGVMAKGLAMRPYVLDQATLHLLHPLNPVTLRYESSRVVAPIVLPGVDRDRAGWMASSSNGDFLAAATVGTIHVVDARAGIQIAHFRPAVPIILDGITDDGSQVFGHIQDSGVVSTWAALDATDGHIIHKISVHLSSGTEFRYDPAAGRLYAFSPVFLGYVGTAPQPPTITSYDVASGSLLARATLGGVMAGSWISGREVNGDPVIEMWQPGIALSPDGRELALLDGSNDQLALIDTGTMHVLRTETLSQPQGLAERIADWLGILPAPALAKEMEGSTISMSFASDGRSIYVTGTTARVDSQGNQTWTGLGVERIDPATGQVGAQALSDQDVTLLWAGDVLYALARQSQDLTVPPVLYRLGPDTLQTQAAHRFRQNAAPMIFILATGI